MRRKVANVVAGPFERGYVDHTAVYVRTQSTKTQLRGHDSALGRQQPNHDAPARKYWVTPLSSSMIHIDSVL